jgi:hypothetical protein
MLILAIRRWRERRRERRIERNEKRIAGTANLRDFKQWTGDEGGPPGGGG